MNRSKRGRGHLPMSVTMVVDLILLSTMCLTDLTVSLLTRLSEEKYNELPVYCQPSTGYFECVNATSGRTYCLPNSLRCRIACSNNADLQCREFAAISGTVAAGASNTTACGPDQFACPDGDATSTVQCIADYLVCDGRQHCPDNSDELLELCKRRNCTAVGHFACLSPGHCVPARMRCDGNFDCERMGLGDFSDELDCPPAVAETADCPVGEFRCPLDPQTSRGGTCLPSAYLCDRFNDCPDGSDELNCPEEVCNSAAGEISCDSRCLKASLRCDGTRDCVNGADEDGCGADRCQFHSEFFCRLSKSAKATCVSAIFVCDDRLDCESGEDEVCPVGNTLCTSDGYWTCKSGQHCVRTENRCDGLPHCPDGSDERDCPKPTPSLPAPRSAPTDTPCPDPRARHLCNGTKATCVNTTAVCANQSLLTCPGPDLDLEATCQKLAAALKNAPKPVCPSSDCPNAGAGQVCRPAFASDGGLVAECACAPGYRMSGNATGWECRDVDECLEELGACDQVCANAPGNFKCSCLSGYQMDTSDTARRGGVCRALGASKLLVATETGIHAVDSDTGAATKVSSGSELKLPKFLDVDVSRKLVFFHTRDGQVGYLPLESGRPVKVLAMDTILDALAYDWKRRLLFYTVPETAGVGNDGFVGVMDAETGRHTALRRLNCPRGLALQPDSGTLYFSLWCGAQPGLYSMRMDGGDLRPLVTGVGAPGHLALDAAHGSGQERLYWLDMRLRGVYTCRLGAGDCTDLHAVWHMGAGYDGIPLGLTVFEDRLLWADIRARGVFSIDKFTGAPLHLVARGPENETTLSAVVHHSVRQPSGNGSLICRCDTAHICISLGAASRTCLCGSGYGMVAGVCQPTAGGNQASSSLAPAAAVASQLGTAAQDTGSQGAMVAAFVASALLVCLVCGVCVAVACLRRSGHLRLGENCLPGVKTGRGTGSDERPAMPKINSRTPLTECEIGIGLENQSSPC